MPPPPKVAVLNKMPRRYHQFFPIYWQPTSAPHPWGLLLLQDVQMQRPMLRLSSRSPTPARLLNFASLNVFHKALGRCKALQPTANNKKSKNTRKSLAFPWLTCNGFAISIYIMSAAFPSAQNGVTRSIHSAALHKFTKEDKSQKKADCLHSSGCRGWCFCPSAAQ